VREHASTAGDVAVDDKGAFMDVDTPEEYARYFSSSSSD
jgi:CTP:molybdopterin cytidylyltransferase MocA